MKTIHLILIFSLLGTTVYAETNRVSRFVETSDVETACRPWSGRKITLVIPFKPGGGYDLMGRAFKPFLERHSGLKVVVSNVTAGNGSQAIQAVVEAKSNRPMIGLINLATLTTEVAEGKSRFSLSQLQGLGILSTENTVWLSKEKIDWLKPPSRVFLASSSSSPYARLSIPAQLLGVDVKPIFGYEGSNDGWMALLRNEVDLMPSTDASAMRNLATGASVLVSMVLTEKPHPAFPGVPHLAGPGGLLDIRSKGLSTEQRLRVMELGSLATILADSTRTLVVSHKINQDMLSCLTKATHKALFDPEFADVAKTQKFALDPLDGPSTLEKIRRVDATLKKHQIYLRRIATGVRESR